MVYDSDQFVANAKADQYNDVGMCLQQVRQWAGIAALYGTAADAWAHTTERVFDHGEGLPVGCVVWWTGGSRGAGHIACYIGDGKIRSTDAPTSGRVGTVDLHWPEAAWGLRWAGASWDINGVTIPHDADPAPRPTPARDAALDLWFAEPLTGAVQ